MISSHTLLPPPGGLSEEAMAIRRPESDRLTESLILLLLAGACYAFFFHGLGNIGLLGPDEPRYAAVSREMYLTQDYVTPRLHGQPWFEKPALLYWCDAISFSLFGINEFAARFPSALAATLSVFFAYFVCRKIWGRAVGLWSSLILASSAGYFVFGRAASTDMLLTAALTMALFCFLAGYNARSAAGHRWGFFGFYAFLGLGALAKGPVAIALPALSLVAYLLFRGRRDEWKQWHPAFILITLAIAAPWYIAVTRANGWEFVQVFFINQNFARFTSTVHGHERPFYFYLPDLVLLTFPWTFMIIPAVRRTLDRNDQILLAFAIIPVLFFSLSGSKLPGYILPSVPPLVVLCARAISKSSSPAFKIAVFLEAGMMVALGIAFNFFGQRLGVDPHVSGVIILLVTFPMAILLAIIGRWLTPPLLAGFNALAMALTLLAAVNFVVPRFETTDTMRPWKAVLQELVPDDQVVFMYRPTRWMEYGLQYYRPSKAQTVVTPDELNSALKIAPKVLFVADDMALMDFVTVPGVEVQIVETVGSQSAFWAWRPQ